MESSCMRLTQELQHTDPQVRPITNAMRLFSFHLHAVSAI